MYLSESQKVFVQIQQCSAMLQHISSLTGGNIIICLQSQPAGGDHLVLIFIMLVMMV